MIDNQDQSEETCTEGYTRPFLTYSNLSTSCKQNSNTFLFKKLNRRLFSWLLSCLGHNRNIRPINASMRIVPHNQTQATLFMWPSKKLEKMTDNKSNFPNNLASIDPIMPSFCSHPFTKM